MLSIKSRLQALTQRTTPAAAAPKPAGGGVKPAVKRPEAFGPDVLNFTARDADRNRVVTSDEYGVGQATQAEFRRYDRNHDGQLTRRELAEGLVTETYQRHLDRQPDGEGLTHYADRLLAGTATPDVIDAEVAASDEAQARQHAAPPIVPVDGAAIAPESPAIEAAPEAPAAEPNGPTKADAPAEPAPATAGETHHISQYHPAGQDAAYNSATGVTNGNGVFQPGYAQCGATSSAMAMRALGYGEGLTDAQLILEMGGIVGTHITNGTGAYVLQQGLDGMDGFQAELAGPGADTAWIRQRLQSGDQVLANGNYYTMAPHENWGQYNANPGAGGHYVAVVGLDDEGRFLVHDPAWDNGGAPIALTDAQLATFINANTNGGFQVAVGREG
jgi:hypothetical protein